MIKAIASFIAVAGLTMMLAGGLTIGFVASEARAENVVTHDDSTRPGRAVIGPLEMKAQADVILDHTLAYTEGQRFSEMDREDETRDLWLMSTAWRTALNLGIMGYAFSAFVIVIGLILVLNAYALYVVDERA